MSELEVSTDETWLENLGVLPAAEANAGEEFVREVTVPIDHTSELNVTWDVIDRSVSLRWRVGDRLVIDSFREHARRLLAVKAKGQRTIVVEYGDRDLEGRIEVRLFPEFAWRDSLLRA